MERMLLTWVVRYLSDGRQKGRIEPLGGFAGWNLLCHYVKQH